MLNIITLKKILTVEERILLFLKQNNNGISIHGIANGISEDYKSVYITIENLIGRGIIKEYKPNSRIRLIYLNLEEKKEELDILFSVIENKIKNFEKEGEHND